MQEHRVLRVVWFDKASVICTYVTRLGNGPAKPYLKLGYATKTICLRVFSHSVGVRDSTLAAMARVNYRQVTF